LTHHSDLALAFFDSFSTGHCFRLAADANNGYGDVAFDSIHLDSRSFSRRVECCSILVPSYVAGSFIAHVCSGLGAYYWAKEFVAPPLCFIGRRLIYSFAISHQRAVQASLLEEYAAVSVLPFAFTFTERICRGGRRRDISGLGAHMHCSFYSSAAGGDRLIRRWVFTWYSG